MGRLVGSVLVFCTAGRLVFLPDPVSLERSACASAADPAVSQPATARVSTPHDHRRPSLFMLGPRLQNWICPLLFAPFHQLTVRQRALAMRLRPESPRPPTLPDRICRA